MPFLAISLVSAGAISYEILLMRLYAIGQWHHFAYMIISIALLGYGASGTFLAITREWLLARYHYAWSLNAVLLRSDREPTDICDCTQLLCSIPSSWPGIPTQALVPTLDLSGIDGAVLLRRELHRPRVHALQRWRGRATRLERFTVTI